jgi:hypothetical protein
VRRQPQQALEQPPRPPPARGDRTLQPDIHPVYGPRHGSARCCAAPSARGPLCRRGPQQMSEEMPAMRPSSPGTTTRGGSRCCARLRRGRRGGGAPWRQRALAAGGPTLRTARELPARDRGRGQDGEPPPLFRRWPLRSGTKRSTPPQPADLHPAHFRARPARLRLRLPESRSWRAPSAGIRAAGRGSGARGVPLRAEAGRLDRKASLYSCWSCFLEDSPMEYSNLRALALGRPWSSPCTARRRDARPRTRS